MKKTTIKFRVRYGETDQMGVVYYGNYAQYLEQGRTEWLRDLGFSYRWMEHHDVQLPVVRLEIDYKRPARYDDLIKVTTTLRNIPTHKIEFDYQIHNEQDELLVRAYTSLVFIDSTTGKLMKAPSYLIERLTGSDQSS
jgi:acyl-CoA thioester hydrolase